uniref:Fe/B12 periplasmic-binding domain-containing protein n=1 Tax=Steinernema glaseri TaxID=37863 RepID=A0A1I7Z8N8_9BILA
MVRDSTFVFNRFAPSNNDCSHVDIDACLGKSPKVMLIAGSGTLVHDFSTKKSKAQPSATVIESTSLDHSPIA